MVTNDATKNRRQFKDNVDETSDGYKPAWDLWRHLAWSQLSNNARMNTVLSLVTLIQ